MTIYIIENNSQKTIGLFILYSKIIVYHNTSDTFTPSKLNLSKSKRIRLEYLHKSITLSNFM